MGAEIPRHWRLKDQRYRLMGEVCNNCEEKIFPPRDICPHCGGSSQKKIEMSGRGTVYSYTVIHEAPAGFEQNSPYVVALVKLEEGPMITAQLTDLDITKGTQVTLMDQQKGAREIPIEVETTDFNVEIGMPVEMVTRKLSQDGDRGLINYGYKFRPLIFSPMEVSMSSK